MKTIIKGCWSVLLMLVTLRVSDCATTTSFNITRSGASRLGPFQGISVSGGLQNNFSPQGVGGGGSGAISFSPITIVAPLSASDTTLIQALVTGRSVEQLDIGFYASGGGNEQGVIYRKITLNQALLTSYKSDTDGEGPVTTFTVLFTRYTDTTYPRARNGTPNTPITTTYDITTRKAVNS